MRRRAILFAFAITAMTSVAGAMEAAAATSKAGPNATASHKMRVGPLRNTVKQIARDRVADPESPWVSFQIAACAVSRNNPHFGGCRVNFEHSDFYACSYNIFLRFRGSSGNRVRVTYQDLQPDNQGCPSKP